MKFSKYLPNKKNLKWWGGGALAVLAYELFPLPGTKSLGLSSVVTLKNDPFQKQFLLAGVAADGHHYTAVSKDDPKVTKTFAPSAILRVITSTPTTPLLKA